MASSGGSASTTILLEDPFPQVQHEVRTKVRELQRQQQQQQLGGARESGVMERDKERRRQQQLEALEQDVSDLRMALDIARADPERFQLSERELFERGKFIDEMTQVLQTLKQPSTSATANANAHPTRTRTVEMDNQHMILQEQDEQLDDLANAVERIGNLGRDMHEELQNQGEMLDDLGGRFDTTLSRMKAIRQRVDVFMQRTGRTQFCTIVWLSVAFFILTILVVMT